MQRIKILASAGLTIAALSGGLLLATPASAKPAQDHKLTICHFTASETNPVVIITIAQSAWKHHEANHNGVTSPHQGQDFIITGDPGEAETDCVVTPEEIVPGDE